MPETADVESMDRQALVEAILDLEYDRATQVEDPDLAQDLGTHVKDLVDELVTLRSGEAASDAAEAGPDAGPDGADGEAARRRRRKRRPLKKGEQPKGPIPQILSLPPGEQARWIFLERYISLEKHEDIFGLNFQPETFADHQDSFDRLIKDLLLLPRALEVAEKNDIPGLQRLFASCVPIFRSPEIGDHSGQPLDSSVENLRGAYPSYFYKRRKKPNWFEAQDFYREPVPGPRWVLCDTEYMNCTLRKPDRKLGSYARDWDLPPEYAHQKTIVEDVYDRVIVGEALGEDLFAGSCNSLTATGYRARKNGPRRLVYTVQRVHKVTIHGKVGIPHWRATRRLWPGLHPTLAFPDLTDRDL